MSQIDDISNRRNDFTNAYLNNDTDILNEYYAFSRFFYEIFLDKKYIVENQNFRAINGIMLRHLVFNINRHPHLWRLFMMIFGVSQ